MQGGHTAGGGLVGVFNTRLDIAVDGEALGIFKACFLYLFAGKETAEFNEVAVYQCVVSR